MSEQGPHSVDSSYAEFFNEQRRIEQAAKDPDMQLAVRYFYEIATAPHSSAKQELFEKAHRRIDFTVEAMIMCYDIHPSNWTRIIDEANEYMMEQKKVS